MSARVSAACEHARALAEAPIVARTDTRAERWLLAGDPQTTPERFFAVLDAHEALGDDGLLRPGVGLVSMGDHFDFHMGDPRAEPSGRAILAWLCAQERTVVLAGNHDVARVAELALETDASWVDAKKRADRLGEVWRNADEEGIARLSKEFREAFPNVPSAGVVAKDFASFSEAQRRLVERALLDGKMRLAALVMRDGYTYLATHAGVTVRELGLLGLPVDAPADAIAAALAGLLREALDRVRPPWEAGARVRLALDPVHVAGRAGVEGGGLLYHRPANPDREGADVAWESDPKSPRRFDPRNLPRGLVQIVGHSGHARCVRDLAPWVAPPAAEGNVALRTLRTERDSVVYEPFVSSPRAGEGTCLMIDSGFADAPLDTIALLRADGVAFAK